MNLKITTFAIVSVLGAGLSATSAEAATSERTEIQMAAKACQAALPVFDGQIRKRPLAVQNEGTSNAFITCGYQGVFGGNAAAIGTSSEVGVIVLNNTGANLTIDCTMVDGRVGINDPIYLPKSIVLGPNMSGLDLFWDAATDNGGLNFIYPAISCNLPTGAGISGTLRIYREEIGT